MSNTPKANPSQNKGNRGYSSEEFIARLQKKMNAVPTCPFCGNKHFVVSEKLTPLLIQDKPEGFAFGTSIPCAVVICDKCGHVDLFSLGINGMLPDQEDKDNHE